MTRPGGRPVGEALAELAATNPALADEVRAALSAKRVRDDLADAEALLREHARAARDSIGRALSVLLVEYDARAGRVVREPERTVVSAEARVPAEPAPVRAVNEKGDVVL